MVVRNPASMVRDGAAVELVREVPLRGLEKLRPALERLDLRPEPAVALDAGASAGGFVQALLEFGARRVYAVDVGFGQLLGSLRQDPRVVVLERTNVADLDRSRVPDPVELVTLDLGYLALADGVPQLGGLAFAPGAQLVALVKPMFELRLAAPPDEPEVIAEAVRRARAGVEAAGWSVVAEMESPVRGSRGAVEWFLHARRD
jgi:23S rRNA (cytidine1920-2'-O)/16S rRNA (cytidine1409-2'-O)-methyltransferase